jgi:hypothetical protein
MSKLDRIDALAVFVQDVFIDGDVTTLCLEPKDIDNSLTSAQNYVTHIGHEGLGHK